MNIEILSLPQNLLEPAFELATEVFIAHSTLHKALGIGLAEYRNYLRPSFQAMVKEGLSVVAVDGDAVMGCLIITDFRQHLNSPPNPPEKFRPLTALTADLSKQYQSVRSIGAGEVVLVDMGAVVHEAAGRGVYKHMRDAAQRIAQQNGFTHVVGELSSAATQHVVLKRLGHQKVAEVFFGEFEFEGGFPFGSIGEPESIVLAEGRL